VEIVFVNKKLERIFNSNALLKKEYGVKQAEAIKRRMAVLKDAPTLQHVPVQKPDRRHELKGRLKGKFAVDLKHPYRLVFEPAYDPVPLNKDGGIDLTKITAIRILNMEDYH
jgi:proteic killer suppression protein